MRRRLIIHIGTGKTGTTSLQSFLKNNSIPLRKLGLSYPNLYSICAEKFNQSYYSDCRANLINGEILLENYIHAKIQHIKNNDNILLYLIKVIKDNLKDNDVIISEELIWESSDEVLFGFIEFLYRIFHSESDLYLVCYLRRQDFYFESYWNELVKTHLYYKNLDSFCDEFKYRGEYFYRLHNLEIILKEQSNNMKINLFEKKWLKCEDVIFDFFNELGIDSQELSDFVRTPNKNMRIDDFVLEIKRMLNESIIKNGSSKVTDYFNPFFDQLNNYCFNNNSNQFYYLSKNDRISLMNYFDKSNVMLKRYLANGQFFDSQYSLDKNITEFTNEQVQIIKIILNWVGYVTVKSNFLNLDKAKNSINLFDGHYQYQVALNPSKLKKMKYPKFIILILCWFIFSKHKRHEFRKKYL